VEGATANELPDPVPADVAEARKARFMEAQAKISARRLAAKVGTTIEVIIDEIDEEGAIGRSKADAPEIDGMVYLNDPDIAVAVGDIVRVEITHSDEHDLWGELV
jgi:ribosomal protein S12 methylthiotransferase